MKDGVLPVLKMWIHLLLYFEQLASFKSLGYEFDPEVTKEMILYFAFEMSWEDDTEKYIRENPYSISTWTKLYLIYDQGDFYASQCVKTGVMSYI